MSIDKLYDDVIMDHIKNARNYRQLPDADRQAEAVSQLCGDTITVYIKLEADRIEDIGFQCVSCGISMASASMMTESIKGKTIEEAHQLIAQCRAVLEGGQSGGKGPEGSQHAVTYEALQAFPSRKTCALVGWHALAGALRGETETISM